MRETVQEKELFESQTKDISPAANTDRAPHLGNDAAHNQRNSRHQCSRVFKGYLKKIENMCHYGKQLGLEPLVYHVVMSLTRTSGCLFQHSMAKVFPVFKINYLHPSE